MHRFLPGKLYLSYYCWQTCNWIIKSTAA